MYYFLKIFIDGIFTALGAFIPIFILMCIHFQIRKIDYRKRKNRIKKLIEVLQLMIDTSENAMEETYKIAEVKDYVELMNKMKKSANISQYIEFIDFVKKNFDIKIKNQTEITKYRLQINYIDDYNFKTYISDLLNNRFPEKEVTK